MPTNDQAPWARAGLAIDAFALGPYETNCYVLRRPGSPECWIFDAGFDPDDLIGHVRALGLKPKALLLTHAHPDHIAGIGAVLAAFPGTPVLIHRDEERWLTEPELNLSAFMGVPVSAPGPDALLDHGQVLRLAGLDWTVLHVPGHSPGGCAFHCPQAHVTISGDALFAGSIGRTDFPGSNFETLERSIRTRLYTLPPDTVVLPGHGPPTTVARERAGNPFVRG
ncbi:MAG: MBL fold metallo-hydrolase [Phycisphaerae bacterium]|nr:MBL fold metallo-hydrolase [Phycisphaerae bacterium]